VRLINHNHLLRDFDAARFTGRSVQQHLIRQNHHLRPPFSLETERESGDEPVRQGRQGEMRSKDTLSFALLLSPAAQYHERQ
jgi:hypothetical protein